MQTAHNYRETITEYTDLPEYPKVHTEKLKVLKIQRTCVHDGPGIRTVIFFSGCALRCLWCQNPEALSFRKEVPEVCDYSEAGIMDVVMKDKEYYVASNGGVTLSGGDPLLQHSASLIHLLKLLKQENIHLAVETAAHVPWKNIEAVAPYVDLFLIDLKVVGDDKLHVKLKKQESQLIHSNIQKLVALNANIQFRMVVVPKHNNKSSNIKATAEFLKSIKHDSIELLKYHNMYEAKIKRLKLFSPSLNITNEQSIAAVKRAANLFKTFGIQAHCVELDVTKHKATFTKRVHAIQNEIRESECHLCFETANLKTNFYKKHGFGKSPHLHRTERLAYLLENKKIWIYPKELIVGNFTAQRVAGHVWEEYYGISLIAIIHQIDTQTPVPFKCSLEDKVNFYTNIFPFWAKHSLIRDMYPSFADWVLLLARGSRLKVGFNNNQAAIAHFVVNHERMLNLGTSGIIEEIKEKQKEAPDNNQDFYNGALIGLRGLEVFAERYADKLLKYLNTKKNSKRRTELAKMAEVCRHVPKYPARTFHEALQSILFLQIALCTESFENAISFGRLDKILYPYFKRDQEAGLLTYEKAKELLACFILKIDEVVIVNDGDTYLGIGRLFESLSTVQSVTFGGVDEEGNDLTNEVTYMLLDICELQPRGANMTARIHNHSPKEYLERIAEVYINGAPMPALYNDEIYIETLKKHYPTTSLQQARNYSIVGCVEPVASNDHFGNTDCANMNIVLPFLQALKGKDFDLWNYDSSYQLEKITTKFIDHHFNNRLTKRVTPIISKNYKNLKRKVFSYFYDSPESMEELLERYQLRMNQLANSVLSTHHDIEKTLREKFTTPLASSLFEGCIKSGKDLYEGGADLNSSGIQAVGVTDVADSLYALNEVVYKKKLYTINEIIDAIDANFEGDSYQQIRTALKKVPKFGNDAAPEAQAWVNQVLQIYVNALKSVKTCPRNGIYTAGYYALNVNIVYGSMTSALPSGRLSGVPLAHSIAPHYGMQMLDLVSSLNSIAGIDFVKYAPNGTTVTFTIDSALFQGEDGPSNLAGLISAYFKKGGMQFQPNILSREILLDAYKNPEKHKYLLVRVAGYCAYFNELSDELKIAIINRTCYS
ncbi:pyruvate formate lyase family protein [Deltaproteobacteria bacterium TL4]